MNEYFTLESMVGFAGATALATLAPMAVSALGGERVQPSLKWVSFVVALLLTAIHAYMAGAPEKPLLWAVGLANGVLVFLAAVGANRVTADRATSGVRIIGEPGGLADRTTLRARQSWF